MEPDVAAGSDLELVRPAARRLGGEVGDGAGDVLLGRGQLGRLALQALVRLLALDRRIHDQERGVNAVAPAARPPPTG